ncbi:lipase secretion chaperone [Leptospira sarikeiensis]|uniref:Lipase helper protein n=1 Tax=Leptospira sarikeiensis TaxID=2484943 RepID=A0A4R9K4Y5_9LEPT|nr:lipase secretion chaperone [Leptospira sarikeiensis]TGL60543.1 lipase chaperone [Leptospira sarikeiensis]
MFERLKEIPPKIWLFSLGFLIFLALVVFLLWEPGSPGKDFGFDGDDSPGFTITQNENGEWIINPEIVATSRELYRDGQWLNYDEILQYASNGELDLVSSLWELRRKCPADYTPDQCNEIVKAFILEQYPGAAGERLIGLFRKYLSYEMVLREFEQPKGKTPEEIYEIVKKKRREIFSDQDAKLIFGLEEAEKDFQFGYNQFLSETKNLSGDKRLARYEEYRKGVYGNYYNTINKREPKFTKYETELFFKEPDLNKLSAAEKDPQVRAIREKYFGKDGADRIEKVYKEIEAAKQKENQTDQEEQAWIKAHPTAKADERNKALNDIRVKNLGQEEAEAYGRRKALEEDQRRLQGQ